MRIPGLALLVGALCLAVSAHAICTLSLTRPVGGPFPAVDIEGFLWVNQTLTSFPLPGKPQSGEKPSLPLHAYWTTRITADDEPGPLGAGWFVPLLESHCKPAGQDELVMITPEGFSQTLRITRRVAQGKEQFPRQLSGSGWTGTQDSSRAIRLDSSCGDRLVFDHKGRLAEVVTEGRAYTLVRNPKGKVAELKLNNLTPLASFEYDEAGRLLRFRISGGAIASCRYGAIPILDSKGKWADATSLTGISFSDGGAFSFDFKKEPASVTFPAQPEVRWNPATRLVQSVGDTTYSITPHPDNFGGAEFRLSAPTGGVKVFYNDLRAGVLLKSQPDGAILKTTRLTSGPNKGLVRTVHKIDGANEVLVEKYEYDANSHATYVFKDGKESRNRFDDRGNYVEGQTQGVLIKRVFDKDNELLSYACITDEHDDLVLYLKKNSPGFVAFWGEVRPASSIDKSKVERVELRRVIGKMRGGEVKISAKVVDSRSPRGFVLKDFKMSDETFSKLQKLTTEK